MENTRIFHKLQFSLTNTSFSGLSTLAKLSPLHRVLIYRTYILPQLRQFWANIWSKLLNKGPYKISISGMRLWLAELQESYKKAQKIGIEGLNGYKEIDGVLHY